MSDEFDNRRKPQSGSIPEGLTTLELKAAANALIGWANAQEISRADLLTIMAKVTAKILCDTIPHTTLDLSEALDRHGLALANEMNTYLFATRQSFRLDLKKHRDI